MSRAQHPFGTYLRQYHLRKAGLTQAKLARLIGYHPGVLARMCRGQRDLTGPSGRQRVLQIIEVLRAEGVLHTLAEANALLNAAGMHPLHTALPQEAALFDRLDHPIDPSPTPIHKQKTLHAPNNRFIGRERERDGICALLAKQRLLTLTGMGGVGKTRLAIEVVTQMRSQFVDGIYMATFVPAAREADVLPTVMSVLPWFSRDADVTLESLIAAIHDRHTLLLLDNCEHVIETSARLVDQLICHCPHLVILTTSRETLQVPGEVVWQVAPLSMPDTAPQSLEQAMTYDAFQLFVDRAQAANPQFVYTEALIAAIVRICRQLDGLPLAIELAAALTNIRSVEEIAAQLEKRLDGLVAVDRTGDPRHRTLGNTIDWSYKLLTQAEQKTLQCLSVFAGGCTLDAIQCVCAEFTVDEMLQLLRALANKSLLVVHHQSGATRYRLLRAIHEFAANKLEQSVEADVAKLRHFNVYLELATACRAQILGPECKRAAVAIDAELDNFRAAMRWSYDQVSLSEGRVQLAYALRHYAYLRIYFYKDLNRWLKEEIRRPEQHSKQSYAQALYGTCTTLHSREEADQLSSLWNSAETLLAECRSLGDLVGQAYALLALNHRDWLAANHQSGLRHAQEAYVLLLQSNFTVDAAELEELLIGETALTQPKAQAITYLEAEIQQLQSEGATLAACHLMLDRMLLIDELGQSITVAQLESMAHLSIHMGLLSHLEFCLYRLMVRDIQKALSVGKAFVANERVDVDPYAYAYSLQQMGRIQMELGNYDQALEWNEKSLAVWKDLDEAQVSRGGLDDTWFDRGQMARRMGDPQFAITCYNETIRLMTTYVALHPLLAMAYTGRGYAALALSDLQAAETDFKMGLRIADQLRKDDFRYPKFNYFALHITAMAMLAKHNGNDEQFAQLAGAAEATFVDGTVLRQVCLEFESMQTLAHQQLGDPPFLRHFQHGSKYVDALIAEVLGEIYDEANSIPNAQKSRRKSGRQKVTQQA